MLHRLLLVADKSSEVEGALPVDAQKLIAAPKVVIENTGELLSGST